MRKLLLFSVLFGFALSIAAQKAQRELVLVDAKGNVVPDGAVLSFSKMEDSEYDDYKQISSGLKLRNWAAKPTTIGSFIQILLLIRPRMRRSFCDSTPQAAPKLMRKQHQDSC